MNPYLVLGIGSGADAAAVKRAYYEAVKRCHPDKYAGTPNYEAAQEELKRVNLAYDMLADKIRSEFAAAHEKNSHGAAEENASQNDNGECGEYYQGYEYDVHALRYAYDMAMERRIDEALLLLSKTKRRGARWHYVHAICRRKSGALADAIEDIEIAMKLDPANADYRDEWRTIIALRTKRRRRGVAIGAAATAAVAVAVVITL